MTSRIEVFYTSIVSNQKIRKNQDLVDRTLAKIPHQRYDIASDQAAKAIWKRKNGGSTELPLILVDGARPGGIEQLEEAVEYGEVRQFLRLDEAPAPSTADNDALLSDLSKEQADALAAELEQAEAASSATPLQPTSEGNPGNAQGAVPSAMVKAPGTAEAEEFETGMS